VYIDSLKKNAQAGKYKQFKKSSLLQPRLDLKFFKKNILNITRLHPKPPTQPECPPQALNNSQTSDGKFPYSKQ
jgi:hypothetical protein